MTVITKIKKDKQGLYAEVGGWICRPIERIGTIFKEGDKVRGSHSPGAFVTIAVGKRKTPTYHKESWWITSPTQNLQRLIDNKQA